MEGFLKMEDLTTVSPTDVKQSLGKKFQQAAICVDKTGL